MNYFGPSILCLCLEQAFRRSQVYGEGRDPEEIPTAQTLSFPTKKFEENNVFSSSFPRGALGPLFLARANDFCLCVRNVLFALLKTSARLLNVVS